MKVYLPVLWKLSESLLFDPSVFGGTDLGDHVKLGAPGRVLSHHVLAKFDRVASTNRNYISPQQL